MASRKPEDLHPDLLPLYNKFMEIAKAQKIDVLCTCTYRNGAEQNQLYAQGRTTPGKIVTRAKAGQSAHNFTINGNPAARAFDIVPIRNGKPVWGKSGADLILWQALGRIGEEIGLNWYGNPKASFNEYPHFELRKG